MKKVYAFLCFVGALALLIAGYLLITLGVAELKFERAPTTSPTPAPGFHESIAPFSGFRFPVSGFAPPTATPTPTPTPTPSPTPRSIQWLNAPLLDQSLRPVEIGFRDDHIVVWRAQVPQTPTPSPEAIAQP